MDTGGVLCYGCNFELSALRLLAFWNRLVIPFLFSIIIILHVLIWNPYIYSLKRDTCQCSCCSEAVLVPIFMATQVAPCIYFFLNSLSGGWSPVGSSRHGGHWLAYCTCPGWLWWWRIRWNEDWQEKTCPSATNPTWLDSGSNPGRRGEKPAANRLSYGAALTVQVRNSYPPTPIATERMSI
jgi:hypothetical protein